jgi:hypothetical protein
VLTFDYEKGGMGMKEMITEEEFEKIISPQVLPGTRVLVYDSKLFKNDIKTPSKTLYKPATVVCRYGKLKHDYGDFALGPYEDLVDVLFDHRPERISHGHFTYGIQLLEEN